MDYNSQTKNLLNTRKKLSDIVCRDCGNVVPQKSYTQLYCSDCSEKRQRETKRRWAAKSYENSKSQLSARRNEKWQFEKPFRSIAGINRSDQAKHGNIFWTTDESLDHDSDILLRLVVPFDQSYSKNSIWRSNDKGHVQNRQYRNQLQQDLTDRIKRANMRWRINKVYLDILVQKPSSRGDAINFLDVIADAVKKGIGLDDYWFAVRRLDWEIVKTDPKVIIGISQVNEDVYPCSYCGLLQPLSEFTKSRSTKFGFSTECKSCMREVRRLAREAGAPRPG